MKPERVSNIEQGSEKEEVLDMELTEEEKLVLNLLKDNSPVDLNELKGQTGLSNKKWDNAIKGLRKHNLATVEKTEEGLLVSLVQMNLCFPGIGLSKKGPKIGAFCPFYVTVSI